MKLKYIIFFLIITIIALTGTIIYLVTIEDEECFIDNNKPDITDNITDSYTCDNMYNKFSCKGLPPEQCDEIPYVNWAKKNCSLGTPDHPIGL